MRALQRVFILVIVITVWPRGEAAATVSAKSTSILAQARYLTVEGQSEKAAQDLEKLPRAELVKAVREGLTEGGDTASLAMKTAMVLKVHEVVPDLKKSFETSTDWNLYATLGSIASTEDQKSLAPLFAKKIKTSDAPGKVALLSTLAKWKIVLDRGEFLKLLKDESFQVRIATARYFEVVRDLSPEAEQLARFDEIFKSDPYQVRLDGMLTFAALDRDQQKKLKDSIGVRFANACEAEKKPLVKTECVKLIELSKELAKELK